MIRSPPYSARRSTSENRFLASATVMVAIGHCGLFGHFGQTPSNGDLTRPENLSLRVFLADNGILLRSFRLQSQEARWVPQPPFSTRTSTPFMRLSNSCLTLGCAGSRLPSAAASCSRPPTKRGPSAYEAACLDGARGNSVPTLFLWADISMNTSASVTPPSES